MISQSERSTAASESQYRISAPNSRSRKTVVLSLDKEGREIIRDLYAMTWQGAEFYSLGSEVPAVNSQTFIKLETPDGDLIELDKVLEAADVVVIVATAGISAEQVQAVCEQCFKRSIMTNGFVLDAGDDSAVLNQTLRAVRPWVISLVTGSDQDYLVESLRSIRA